MLETYAFTSRNTDSRWKNNLNIENKKNRFKTTFEYFKKKYRRNFIRIHYKTAGWYCPIAVDRETLTFLNTVRGNRNQIVFSTDVPSRSSVARTTFVRLKVSEIRVRTRHDTASYTRNKCWKIGPWLNVSKQTREIRKPSRPLLTTRVHTRPLAEKYYVKK